MKIEKFDLLPSTQTYAKEKRKDKEDLIVLAKRQTSGMGTKGRSFSSNEGGVYVSKLSFHENFPAKEAFKIMAFTAVAVCETLSFYGLTPKIKWPNDIFVNDKKISGILIEQVISGGSIVSSIVGVGLNVCNELPEELLEIATTMEQALGKKLSVEDVANHLIKELLKERKMENYLSYLGYMGREATLRIGDELVPATLLSVDERGELLVEIHGEKRRLSAAEVSVRGL